MYIAHHMENGHEILSGMPDERYAWHIFALIMSESTYDTSS